MWVCTDCFHENKNDLKNCENCGKKDGRYSHTSRRPQVPQIIVRQNKSEEYKDRSPIPSGLLEHLNISVTGSDIERPEPRQTVDRYGHRDHGNTWYPEGSYRRQRGQSKTYQDELPECQICLQQKKSVPATSYCRDCNERYCDRCTEKHKTMKQTSGHEIVNSCSVFRNFCYPCKHMNKVTEAAKLCEDCREFLCENCTKFHSAEKKYKEHKVTAAPEALKCIICQSQGKDIPAVCYCESCVEDADPFCENCAEHHTAMKINRDHTLSHNMAEYLIGVEQHKHTKSVERVSRTIRQLDPNVQIIQTGDLERKIMRLERPYVTDGKHKSDQIDLKWTDNDSLGKNEVYQVQFKDKIIGKWQIFKKNLFKPINNCFWIKSCQILHI